MIYLSAANCILSIIIIYMLICTVNILIEISKKFTQWNEGIAKDLFILKNKNNCNQSADRKPRVVAHSEEYFAKKEEEERKLKND